MAEVEVDRCAVCGGLWASERLHLTRVLGEARRVCQHCLRDGLHP